MAWPKHPYLSPWTQQAGPLDPIPCTHRRLWGDFVTPQQQPTRHAALHFAILRQSRSQAPNMFCYGLL